MATNEKNYTLKLSLEANGVDEANKKLETTAKKLDDTANSIEKLKKDLGLTTTLFNSFQDDVKVSGNTVDRLFSILRNSPFDSLKQQLKDFDRELKDTFSTDKAKLSASAFGSYFNSEDKLASGLKLGEEQAKLQAKLDKEESNRRKEYSKQLLAFNDEIARNNEKAAKEESARKKKQSQDLLSYNQKTYEEDQRIKSSIFKASSDEESKLLEYTIARNHALSKQGSDKLVLLKIDEVERIRQIYKRLEEDNLKLQNEFLQGNISKGQLNYALTQNRQGASIAIDAARQPVYNEEIAAEATKKKLEAAKQEAQQIKQIGLEQLAEVKRQADEELAIKVYGRTSARAMLTKAANDEARILEELARKRKSIEEDVKQTIISRAEAEKAITKHTEEANRKITDIYKQLPATVQQAGNSIQTLGEHFSRLGKHILEVYVAWGTLNLISSKISEAVGSIIPVGIALDSVKASLESTIGTSAGANSILNSLGQEAKRTGLEIGNLRTNFASFQASTSLAGASLEDTWKMFQNINTVSTALHKNTDETNHIFLAMSQIFNKNKVQSEELVKQLGNLLPGAFASFAAAYKDKVTGVIGILPSELSRRMKEGLVDAQSTMLDFTEFYAKRFAGSFVLASQMLNADIGRMKSEFSILGETIYSLSSGALQEFVKGITNMTKSFTNFVQNGKELNAVLYGTKDIINSLIVIGLANLLLKIEALVKETNLLASAMSFLKNPTIIVGGIALIVNALTDYIHSTQEATTKTTLFFEELRKKREEAAAAPAIKLRIEIDKDAGVKQAGEQVQSMREKLKDTAESTLPVSFLGSENISRINSDIEMLRKYKSDVEAITHSEYLLGIGREKLTKIYAAYTLASADVKLKEEERAKAEIQAKTIEAEKKQAEFIYGSEPRKEVNQQTTVADLKVWLAERNLQRAKADGNYLDAIKAANEKQIASESAKNEQIKAKYKEELSLLEIKEKTIADRKAKGVFGNEYDIAAEKDVVERRKAYEQQFQIDSLKAEAENIRERAALQKEAESAAKEARKIEYKDTSRDFANLALELEANLTQLDSQLKQGQVSIDAYVKKWTELKLSQESQKGQALEQNYALSLQSGTPEEQQKFYDELRTQQIRMDNIRAEEEAKRTQLLEQFNEKTQAIHAEYLKNVGQEEEAAAEQYALKNKLVEAQLQQEIAGGNVIAAQRLEELRVNKQIAADKAAVAKINKQIDTEQLALKEREYNLDLDLKSGVIDQITFQQKLFETRQETLKLIQEQLDAESKLNLTAEERLKLERQKKEIQQANTDKIGSSKSILNRGSGTGPGYTFANSITQFRADQANISAEKMQNSDEVLDSKFRLEAAGKTNAQIEKMYSELLDKKAQRDQDYILATGKSYTDMFAGIFSAGAETYQGLTDMNVKMYGANSKEAKKSFNMWKQMKIAETISSTASGAINAYSAMAAIPYVGPFLGAAAAALVVAYGAKQISDISSQQLPAYHGGLTYQTKDEETAIIKRGERVVSPRQNVELVKAVTYINARAKEETKNNLTNTQGNVRIINSIDPSVTHEHMGSVEGERIIMNIIRRNQAA